MQQEYVDFRSIDRNSGTSEDFILKLPGSISGKKVSSISFSNIEIPNVRHTIEEKENALAFSEGIAIGDHEMKKAFNQLILETPDGSITNICIPGTLMPVSFTMQEISYNDDGSVSTIQSSLTSVQNHGLKSFFEWVRSTGSSLNALVVGTEMHPTAASTFSAGVMVDDLPALNLEDEKKIRFSVYTINSLRVGTNDGGYIYCPPLHLQEIVSLLNFIAKDYTFYLNAETQHIDRSIVHVKHNNGEKFRIRGTASANSLMSVLGLSSSGYRTLYYGVKNPEVMRLRVAPGFYASPPSLVANAIERSIQGRCDLRMTEATQQNGHTFVIGRMDAIYNQQISVPNGVYTPERLVNVIQTVLTDVNLTIVHVDDRGYENVGWVQYTFSSDSNFPFVLDFTSAASAKIAFALGFEQRRYTSKKSYTGTSIAVAATRNTLPCPPVSYTGAGLRAPLTGPRTNAPRYPSGLYTISGTNPNIQRFQLIAEPGQAWAVPNEEKQRTFFTNIDGAGVVDLTTRALPRQQVYDYRVGDILRVTGYHKFEQTFSVSAQSITGSTGASVVTGVHSDSIGGRGYVEKPKVSLKGELTDPKEFATSHMIASFPTIERLVSIVSLYAPLFQITGIKTINPSTGNLVISISAPFQIEQDFASYGSIRGNLQITEHFGGVTNSFVFTPNEYSVEMVNGVNTIHIPIDTSIHPYFGESTTGNTLTVDARYELFGATMDTEITEGDIQINTTSGEITFTPLQKEGMRFVFAESDFSIIGVTGFRTITDGELAVTIAETTPLVYNLLKQDVGKTITFSPNEFMLTSTTMKNIDDQTNTMKCVAPYAWAPPLVQEYDELVFLVAGNTYRFVAANVSIQGNANLDIGTFVPPTPDEYPYTAQTAPHSVGVVGGAFAGTYAYLFKRYNFYVYAFDTTALYLHHDNGLYSWYACDLIDVGRFANPTSSTYGGGTAITQGLTTNQRFQNGSSGNVQYHFLGSTQRAGKFVILNTDSIYSKTLIGTAMRPTGMLHPTIQPVLMGDRIVCYNVSEMADDATYLYPPTLSIAGPNEIQDSDGINSIVYAGTRTVHNPERILVNIQVEVVPEPLMQEVDGNSGFVGVVTFMDGHEESFRIVDVSGNIIVMMLDDLGTTVVDVANMKTFRLSPGRAISINHTTLTNTANYCIPNMAELLCRQEYWGQDLPMNYEGVVPIQQGYSENIRSITITGTTTNLSTDITYENESASPLMVQSVESRKSISVVSITNDGTQLYLNVDSILNLYNGDHISILSANITNARITSIDATPPRLGIDTDPNTTPYWYAGTVDTPNTIMHVNTRKITLSGTFDPNDISRNHNIYVQGSTEDVAQSDSQIISGFYQVDRSTGFINNGAQSNLYINYPHAQQADIVNTDPSVVVVVSNAYVRLTSATPFNWIDFTDNGIRLRNNDSLEGIHTIIRSTTNTADFGASTTMLPSLVVGSSADVIANGTMVITKISKNGVAPIQAGDKVYLSGTNNFVPDGPYTGTLNSEFGHSDQRAFDGVWIATTNESNDSFEVAYDSAFGERNYTDPQPGDSTETIPAAFSRPLLSRLSFKGSHSFSEKMFVGGYDILDDSTWKLRIFNTADPTSAGITNLGVGGFFHYNPSLIKAHAIAKVTGTSQHYQISDVVPAVPGFVSKHDDPTTPEEDMITPPVQMSYADGIPSQLNTQFTGAEPPKGHATVEANINNGHIIPSNLLPTGARIVGVDKDGVQLSYNISGAYIPGRMTHDTIDGSTRTLLNTHRLRLVLSDQYNREFVGPITIVNTPMINGVYNCPPPVVVTNANVLAGGLIQCSGPNRPSIGDRVTSDDIEAGKFVGNISINSADTWSVNIYPPGSSFTGETSVTFENVTQTVAYEPPVAAAASYVPVQNSNVGSSNESILTGKYVRVPNEGTKTSFGETVPTYNDGRYLIPPRVEGQEIEINAGLHTTPYAAGPTSSNSPSNLIVHVPHSVSMSGTTNLATWGPISLSISDAILSVPTVCFPGAQHTYHFSDLSVTFGGDYNCAATQQFHADATMMVVNNNETRVGILTNASFDAHHKFRYMFEYNPNNLNAGKGFTDTTQSGKIFFSFSRIFEPRLELLPEHTDAMAIFGSNRKSTDMVFAFDVRNWNWPDSFNGPSSNGHALLPRQRQFVGSLLGATKNMFGHSAYILPSQWNSDGKTYRLLVIEPRHHPMTGHASYCTVIDEESEGSVSLGEHMTNSQIFMKMPYPSAYNTPGPQPRMMQLNPPVYLDQLRIRVLDDDMTPHPLHGRELSISLVFDAGKSVGQRHP